MLDLIHDRHEKQDGQMTGGWVTCEEVASGAGAVAARYADVLAFAIWPSLGHKLLGYEVKASKADLKRELADLSKHEAVAKYCDEWWLVAWDEAILLDGIPETWGILLTKEVDGGGEHGERKLVVHRKAAPAEPVPWSKHFIASLVRNAHDQRPAASFLARVANNVARQSRADGEMAECHRWEAKLSRLNIALYGENKYKWPREAQDPDVTILRAVELLAIHAPTVQPAEKNGTARAAATLAGAFGAFP
jgi:hypothetical protein